MFSIYVYTECFGNRIWTVNIATLWEEKKNYQFFVGLSLSSCFYCIPRVLNSAEASNLTNLFLKFDPCLNFFENMPVTLTRAIWTGGYASDKIFVIFLHFISAIKLWNLILTLSHSQLQSKRELFFKNEIPTPNANSTSQPITSTVGSTPTPAKPEMLNGNGTVNTNGNSGPLSNNIHNKENVLKKPERSKQNAH